MPPRVPRPLKLAPCFSQRAWGGERLRTLLGKAAPAGERIGESWELSDHPEGLSRIASGEHEGEFFGELLRRMPRRMLGLRQAPRRFPLLVKYIDAAEDLSLQVHPDDEYAGRYGDRGKAECWYVMECEPGAEVIRGLQPGITPELLAEAAAESRWERVLRRHPIHPGSFVYVPPGTVHAILGGTLLCEVQQASNQTYRLWDWGRMPARELHVGPALEVARAGEHPPEAVDTRPHHGVVHLMNNGFFDVTLHVWHGCEEIVTWDFENPHGLIVNVLDGAPEWRNIAGEADRARRGETWFLPAGLTRLTIDTLGRSVRLLVTRSLELDSPELLG